MLNIKVTTDVENGESVNANYTIESQNSSIEEYLSAIVGIVEEICTKSSELKPIHVLSMVKEHFDEQEKNS